MLENGSTIVKQFYEEEAAIRELSKQNEILELVEKLNSILFASTIDNPTLNSFNSSLRNLNHLRKKAGRNRNEAVNYDQQRFKQDGQETMNQSIGQIEAEEKASLNSSLSRTNSSKADLNLPLSRNSSYSSNYQQDDLDDKSDDNEPNETINSNILLTPIVAGNYSVTDQFVATNYDEDEKASDFSNQSCNTSCSSTPAFQSKELANFERTKRQFDKEFAESFNKQHSLEIEPSKGTQNRKLFSTSPSDQIEEAEERICKLESQNVQLKNENKQLKVQLKKYIDAISLLSHSDRDAIFKCANSSTAKSQEEEAIANDLSEQISERAKNLETKNNFNYHQQPPQSQHKQQTITERTSDCKQQINPQYISTEFNTSAYLNYRDSVEYERKLVQVAEMFSEIVDYNDRLNRVLMQKDATIKVLKDQLIELRGPVSLFSVDVI